MWPKNIFIAWFYFSHHHIWLTVMIQKSQYCYHSQCNNWQFYKLKTMQVLGEKCLEFRNYWKDTLLTLINLFATKYFETVLSFPVCPPVKLYPCIRMIEGYWDTMSKQPVACRIFGWFQRDNSKHWIACSHILHKYQYRQCPELFHF